MAIFSNSIIPAGAAAADDVVTKSVRFNSDGYLTRTFSASTSDQKKRTISFWVKRSELDDNGHQPIISYNDSNSGGTWAFSGSGGGGSAVNDDFVMNDRNDTTGVSDYLIRTTGLFRDVAAWYHFCIKYDTTNATPADRIQLWVNGKRVTALNMGDTGYPALNYTTTRLFTASTGSQYVGGNGHASTHLDGYLSDFYFIDGTALDATSFAEEDGTTGQWKPKAFVGIYGDNGFHLEFKETGTGTASSTTIGADTSVNTYLTATGGTVTTDGDYKVHTFNSTGTFEVTNTTNASVEYLVIAGGGGGGLQSGGGGGAGGYLAGTLAVTKDTYAVVVVSAGGAGSTSYNATGASGSDSTFSTITSDGGGGGGGSTGTSGVKNGVDGGSGGGANPFGSAGTGTAGPPRQGYDGGTGDDGGGHNFGSGGGGGAGAVGGDGTTGAYGGDGGAGVASSITGASVPRGGGGGGCSPSSSNTGDGGSGGGGDAGYYAYPSGGTSGTDGGTNKGGGGGGGGYNASGIVGGSGGSGVVIIRYKFQ